ncbi:MAG: hydroxymethylbilane synthase [halophilic archaeon J07HX64]|jgi:hydroxymethylbilane synthase (EC 2.5.1.61)|nr:MAG: hydroxymethylbilane synthase [halophilic archaeon J07HX64]
MSLRGGKLELATRGSKLARRQASTITQKLAERRITAELVEVETTGDQPQEALVHQSGTTGAFVRSLDERVLAEELDGAVHSMRHMPTDRPDGLIVAAVPERGPVDDVLVTPDGTALSDLPTGATVGTSSLRRRAQLLADRPDLEIAGLRGAVDTRVEKLLAPTRQREHERRLEAAGELDDEANDETGTDREYDRTPQEWFEGLSEIERRALDREVETEYDAICLAAAGLERSGLFEALPVEHLDPGSFVPAPAQGAVAVTALDGETATRVHDAIDHPPTRVEVTVERTVLSELGGDRVAPVGVHARLQGAVVTTAARVLSREGTETIQETRKLPVESHAEAAAAFAADLADRGATELLDRARRERDDAKQA